MEHDSKAHAVGPVNLNRVAIKSYAKDRGQNGSAFLALTGHPLGSYDWNL